MITLCLKWYGLFTGQEREAHKIFSVFSTSVRSSLQLLTQPKWESWEEEREEQKIVVKRKKLARSNIHSALSPLVISQMGSSSENYTETHNTTTKRERERKQLKLFTTTNFLSFHENSRRSRIQLFILSLLSLLSFNRKNVASYFLFLSSSLTTTHFIHGTQSTMIIIVTSLYHHENVCMYVYYIICGSSFSGQRVERE